MWSSSPIIYPLLCLCSLGKNSVNKTEDGMFAKTIVDPLACQKYGLMVTKTVIDPDECRNTVDKFKC